MLNYIGLDGRSCKSVVKYIGPYRRSFPNEVQYLLVGPLNPHKSLMKALRASEKPSRDLITPSTGFLKQARMSQVAMQPGAQVSKK